MNTVFRTVYELNYYEEREEEDTRAIFLKSLSKLRPDRLGHHWG